MKKENIDMLEKQCNQIYIYHSKDDPLVAYEHAEKLSSVLSSAILESFETR